MNEIRERFVRDRFGERNNFGTPNIERWLKKQRAAKKPDLKVWRDLLCRSALRTIVEENEAVRVLEAGGYRLSDRPQGFFEKLPKHSHTKRLEPLLLALHMPEKLYSSAVYLSPCMESHPVVVIHHVWGVSTYGLVETYSALGSDIIYGSLLSCWKECMGQSSEQSLRAESARAEIVHFADVKIREVRQSACTDFERAVAVNGRGTRIIDADMVYVWSDGKKPPVPVRVDLCRKHKILLLSDERGRIHMEDSSDVEACMQRIAKSLAALHVTEERSFKKVDGTGILLVHKSNVPDYITSLYDI